MLFGLEVPGEVVAAGVALLVIVAGGFTTLFAWGLKNNVDLTREITKLGGVVSALEAQYQERSADHERRLHDLEQRHRAE